MKLNKTDRAAVIAALLAEYDGLGCALEYGSNFQLLAAVVLSAQTTDVSVNKATPALFERAPDAFAMAEMTPGEIEPYIRSIGLYRAKAKSLSALSAKLVSDYGGQVPGSFEELTGLPGVGRKTANVVLAEAFGEQRIAVDTHVFRLANRIGLVSEEDTLGTEKALMKAVPEDKWTQMHHALIWHGRRVCSAKNPHCGSCCISGLCKKNKL